MGPESAPERRASMCPASATQDGQAERRANQGGRPSRIGNARQAPLRGAGRSALGARVRPSRWMDAVGCSCKDIYSSMHSSQAAGIPPKCDGLKE
jgi:hypothetical protein